MILDFQRVVAYICPFCSNLSTRSLSLFNFSGGADIKLICPVNGCHEECAQIHQGKNKYRIDIECPLCGETHSHTIKPSSFWNKRLVTYKCPDANVEIFYIGEHNAVENALMQNAGIYDNLDDEYPHEPDSEQINLYNKIIERVRYLYEHDCISCSCGNDRISAAVANNMLVFTCSKCHKTRYVEFSEDTLRLLKNAGSIVI